jgi:peptide/nickel transport system permease protein
VIRFARTAQLVLTATALTVLVGIPAGIYAARRRGTFLDPLASTITMIGFSVPAFVIGPILVYAFALWLGLLPSGGYVGPAEGLGQAVLHMVLPAVTLAASPTATAMRMSRSAFLEQMSADYVRTARGKGLGEHRVVSHHILRNAILPVLSILSLQIGAMFASSVIVETIYNWPGMNLFMLQAINVRDYPVIQAVVLLAASIFVLLNFLTDMTYAFIDPRIRYG